MPVGASWVISDDVLVARGGTNVVVRPRGVAFLLEEIIAVLFFAKEERRLLQAPVWTGAWRSALFATDMEAIVDMYTEMFGWPRGGRVVSYVSRPRGGGAGENLKVFR